MPDLEKVGVQAVVEGFAAYVKSIQEMDAATAKLGSGLEQSASKTDKANEAFGKLQKVSAVATAGFVGLGALAVKTSMDFEKGLSQVGAIAGATAEEMDGLRETALRIGKDTAFSASEATKAMEELAAGGVNVTDIMGGAADAVVALAAAGGTDMATAARAASDAMNDWGLKTDDLTNVVNNLAGAANVSKFDVTDMSYAMAQGGAVAAQSGVSFDEFATSIAATASAFSSGQDAGTSFKTFITSLANPTDKAKAAMDAIGFSAYDASGNLKSMADITQNLHDALGPLSEQQRAQAAATIFGSDAMRTALQLSKLTGDEFVAMSDKMRNTDAAAVAAQRMDNLAGDVEQLKGSLETLGITIGSKAIPLLSQLAKGATSLTNAFTTMPGSSQGLLLAITGLVTAMPALIGLATKLKDGIQGIGAAAETTRFKVTAAAASFGALLVFGDLFAQKTSGHGLLEWVFGDPASADRAADAVNRLNIRMEELGEKADRGKAAADMIIESLGGLANSSDEAARKGGNFFSQQVAQTKATHDWADSLKGLAQDMVKSKASFEDYQRVHQTLSGEQQKLFDQTVDYDARLNEHQKQIDVAALKMHQAASSAGELAGAVEEQKQPVADANQAFLDLVGTFEKEEDRIKRVKEVFQQLVDAFAASNPTVISLTAQNAILQEKIDDIKGSTDKLTAAQQKEVDGLQKQIDANSKVIDGYTSNQKAVEGILPALKMYMGETGIGGLLAKMAELKVSSEDQIYVQEKVFGAFDALQKPGGVPGAIAQFAKMKQELSPAVWEPIAQAAGPKLVQQITSAYTGQPAIDLLNQVAALGGKTDDAWAKAMRDNQKVVSDQARYTAKQIALDAEPEARQSGTALGAAITDGMAVGLAQIAAAQAAVVNAVGRIMGAGRAAAEAKSPSERAAREIGEPISEGIAIGILRKLGAVASAAASVVTAAVSAGVANLPDLNYSGLVPEGLAPSLGSGFQMFTPDQLRGLLLANEKGANVFYAPATYATGATGHQGPEWQTIPFDPWAAAGHPGAIGYPNPGSYGGISGGNWANNLEGGPIIPQLASGIDFVRRRMLAILDPGEAVLTAAQNRAWGPGSVNAPSGGGASLISVSVPIDMRNSQFTGTAQENARAFEQVAERVIQRHLGRGSRVAGVSS